MVGRLVSPRRRWRLLSPPVPDIARHPLPSVAELLRGLAFPMSYNSCRAGQTVSSKTPRRSLRVQSRDPKVQSRPGGRPSQSPPHENFVRGFASSLRAASTASMDAGRRPGMRLDNVASPVDLVGARNAESWNRSRLEHFLRDSLCRVIEGMGMPRILLKRGRGAAFSNVSSRLCRRLRVRGAVTGSYLFPSRTFSDSSQGFEFGGVPQPSASSSSFAPLECDKGVNGSFGPCPLMPLPRSASAEVRSAFESWTTYDNASVYLRCWTGSTDRPGDIKEGSTSLDPVLLLKQARGRFDYQ